MRPAPAPVESAVTSRRYRSTRRTQQAEQTRSLILEAAARLFTTKGWAATGMRDIAQAAGVATETVYSHFSSKSGLFRAAMDIAVVGDDAPIAVAERPEFRALATGPHHDRILTAVQITTAIHLRTAGFAKVLREAAPTDPVIAEMLRGVRERYRMDVAAGLEYVIGRPPTEVERDGLWAVLSVDVYLLLTEESGWSVEQYMAWLTNTLMSLLPGSWPTEDQQ